MNVRSKVKQYLEYCEFRKELDAKTLKAYRIDLRQYFDFVHSDNPQKDEIEIYITDLHKKYKQKTVKRERKTRWWWHIPSILALGSQKQADL